MSPIQIAAAIVREFLGLEDYQPIPHAFQELVENICSHLETKK